MVLLVMGFGNCGTSVPSFSWKRKVALMRCMPILRDVRRNMASCISFGLGLYARCRLLPAVRLSDQHF
jgi:hypothetical protein